MDTGQFWLTVYYGNFLRTLFLEIFHCLHWYRRHFAPTLSDRSYHWDELNLFIIIATILPKIMWTPNFSNANINIETFFHEICRPLAPIQCCFAHLNFKSFIYQHWIGSRRGRNFLGINSVEIHLFLFDPRGVHNNFCQDCLKLSHISSRPISWI
jgi:hypothetical protein